MKSERVVGNDAYLEPDGRWLVLCDVMPRDDEESASPEEIETLVNEAVAEHLRYEKRPMSGTVLKEALDEAHRKLRLACSNEPSQPAVSALIIAEVSEEEGGSHFLVAGAGDCQVYGASNESVELAFRDPVAGAKKSKKRTDKNRLGASDELKVNTQQFSSQAYTALIACTYDAYAGIDWDQPGVKILAALRELTGEESSRRQAVIVTAGSSTKKSGGRRGGVLAMCAIGALVVAGGGLLVKGHNAKQEPSNIVRQEITAPRGVEAIVNEMQTLPTTGEAPTEELLVQIREGVPTERKPVVEKLTLPDNYEEQLAELSLMLDAELEAQQAILDDQKSELGSLRKETEEYHKLKGDFFQLSDLLAAETTRMEQLEAALDDHQTQLIDARVTLASQESLVQSLQEDLAQSLVQSEDLQVTVTELSHTRDALTMMLSESEANADRLNEQIVMYDNLNIAHEAEIAAQGEQIRQIEQFLADAHGELATRQELVDQLKADKEYQQTELALVEEEHIAIVRRLDALAALNEEHEIALAEEQTRHEGTKVALANEITLVGQQEEELQQAAQQAQFLEAVVADLRERDREQQALVEEVMVARVDLSDRLSEATTRHEELLGEKEHLLAKINTLEDVQQKYQQERALREDKDEMLARLAANLEGWKMAVSSLENSRTSLAQELAELRAYQEMVHNQKGGVELQESPKQAKVQGGPRSVTRVHLVSPGESLDTIALRYYGAAAGRDALLEANQEILTDAGAVRVGTALVIP